MNWNRTGLGVHYSNVHSLYITILCGFDALTTRHDIWHRSSSFDATEKDWLCNFEINGDGCLKLAMELNLTKLGIRRKTPLPFSAFRTIIAGQGHFYPSSRGFYTIFNREMHLHASNSRVHRPPPPLGLWSYLICGVR